MLRLSKKDRQTDGDVVLGYWEDIHHNDNASADVIHVPAQNPA